MYVNSKHNYLKFTLLFSSIIDVLVEISHKCVYILSSVKSTHR